MKIEVYETSEAGNKLTKLESFPDAEQVVKITISPKETFQKITGFGGSLRKHRRICLMS